MRYHSVFPPKIEPRPRDPNHDCVLEDPLFTSMLGIQYGEGITSNRKAISVVHDTG